MMMCELVSDHLIEYLDGDATTDLTAHVVTCPTCRAKIARLAETESALQKLLDITACPATDQLGEFYLDTLISEDALQVSMHLQTCSTCQENLNQVADFVDTEHQSSMILYPFLNNVVSSYGLGAYRAGRLSNRLNKNHELTYFINEAEINLEIQRNKNDNSSGMIWGLVTGITLDNSFSAELRPTTSGNSASATTFSELGDFSFTDIQTGVYELVINGTNISYLLRGIQV